MGCPRCKSHYSLRKKRLAEQSLKGGGSVVWIICTHCKFEFALRPEAVPPSMKTEGE